MGIIAGMLAGGAGVAKLLSLASDHNDEEIKTINHAVQAIHDLGEGE